MSRTVSVRPDPTSPPSPTISPAMTEKPTPRTRVPRDRFSTRSTSSPMERCGALGNIAARGRPTIMRMTSSMPDSRGVVTPGELAVLHHRDPVGDAEHLFEAVRDVDDPDPFGAEPGDDAMQALGIAGREDGGRLVEDDDANLLGERLGDLDHLLVRDREVADRAPRVDVEPEPVEEVARAAVHAGPGDDGGQLPHEDVLGHRKIGGERRLLVDDRDAARCRDPRVVALLRLAADQDLAGVARDLAGQDAHQRRLAGAILAEQRMDLAGLDVEVDGLQGPHPSEGPR